MVVSREIIQHIAEYSEKCLAPDGKEYSVIGHKEVNTIAQARGTSVREIEIAALQQDVVPRSYLRNIGTIGRDGQIELLRSAVAIVGVGGLGGTIIELLARQGIGHIIIIDDDCFSEEDLNRQLMSTEEDLGENKAMVAARRVGKINSATTVTSFAERLTRENAHRLLKDAKVVADGLDNLPLRFVVEEACRGLRIPFVHGAVAGFGGQLMTIFPEDRGLSSIYGPSHNVPERGVEVKSGTPSATPTMIAAWQVQEVIKVITGIGKPLRNNLIVLDAAEGIVDKIELRR